MAGMMKISPEEVMSIAGTLRNLNSQLEETLDTTKQQVNGLSGSWTGAAADATINAFNGFSAKYFSNYKDLINQYIKFLEQNVAGSYTELEKAQLKLTEEI